MEGWRDILSSPDFSGFRIRETNVPAYDADTVERCARLCRDNLCGRYGTCWACPPGHTAHMDVLGPLYNRALLISMVQPGSPGDEELMREADGRIKTAVRTMVSALRGAGYKCRGLCDGGCSLCPECAYPEPCRHPDMVLPSVSAVGIDMSGYLESVGETLEFRDDLVTLYAIILFDGPD